jgi:hypothetical protein
MAELETGKLKGEIGIDEAYFGGRREVKRDRGAGGKIIVCSSLDPLEMARTEFSARRAVRGSGQTERWSRTF